MSSGTDASAMFPADAILAELNQDAEWRLAARFWTAGIDFFVDGDHRLLTIENGRAVSFAAVAPDSGRSTIRIGGPAATWRALLDAVPRPFFQDFLPASLHHAFTCEGDMESFFAYYGAISRILAVMRRAAGN